MNSKRLLHGGLFADCFSRLKVVGLVGTALSALFGFIMTFNYAIQYKNVMDIYPAVVNVDFSEVMYGMILVFIVFVPLLMMVAFGYVNRRNGCDFYHAIPIKRHSMFISSMLAVLVWSVIILVSGTVVSLLVFAFNSHISLNCSTCVFVLTIFSGIILVMGAFSVGISTTGTPFTNIIVSIMLLLVPRVLLYLVVELVREYIPFLYFGTGFAGLSYNVVIKTLVALFQSDNLSFSFTGFIYSTILGIIYAVIGGIAFCKRKSESASMASISNTLQCIFRLIPSTFISLIATAGLLVSLYGTGDSYTSNFYIVVIYIIAVVTYFLYELITTRKWSRVVKSIKQLPILIGINILVGAGMAGLRYDAVNNIPEVSDISSIRIESMDLNDSLFNLIGNRSLTSDDAKEIIVEALQDEINGYEQGLFYESYVYEYKEVDVAITTGSRTSYRRVYINDSDYLELIKEVIKESSTDSLEELLPKYNDQNYNFNIPYYDFSQEEIQQIYKSALDEIGTLQNLIAFNNSNYNDKVQINISSDNSSRYYSLPINEKTPKTKLLLTEIINSKNDKNAESLPEYYYKENYIVNGSFNFWNEGTYYFSNENNEIYYTNNEYYYGSGNMYSEEVFDKILEILGKSKDSDISSSDEIVTLNYTVYSENTNDEIDSFTHAYVISDEDYDEILKLVIAGSY